MKTPGRVEIVVADGDGVSGHDPATGKELWRARGLNPDANQANRVIASVLAYGDMIYVPSRVRPLIAFRTGGNGDVTDTHKAWSINNGPDVPTPVSDGKYLYIVNDHGIVTCLDARTGQDMGQAENQNGDLQRLARARGWQDLCHQRRRRHHGVHGRSQVRVTG